MYADQFYKIVEARSSEHMSNYGVYKDQFEIVMKALKRAGYVLVETIGELEG